MEIILDPAFFTSLIQVANLKSENYLDFERFLGKLKNCKLIVFCDSFENFYKKVKEDPYLELLINNSPVELEIHQLLLNEIKDLAFYKNGSCFKLFMLNESVEVCNTLSEQFGYEYLSSENLEKKWTIYNSSRDDSSRKVTARTSLPANNRFDSWDCLDTYIHPLTNILINDSYILNDKQNQKIRDNLLPLILKLAQKAPKNLPLEITILSDPSPNYLDYEKIHARLSTELDQFLGADRYKLNLIRFSTHDRFILTNYFYITSGKGFTFFREDKGVNYNSTTTIEFYFIFSTQKKVLIFDDLMEIKEKLEILQNSDPGTYSKIIHYFPRKESRIFNLIS